MADIIFIFAARATASFPGAFPPATVAEMDELLAERGDPWPDRDRSLRHTLGIDPDDPIPSVFVDGSVVMNKPFAPAIGERPAMREVVRRLIYIDAIPETERRPVDRETVPGFFRIILASLAHIPRSEPVGDELAGIEEANRKARHLSDLITATDPFVTSEVATILSRGGNDAPATQHICACRREANAKAHHQAGFMHLPYLKLKLAALSDHLAELIARLADTDDTLSLTRSLERRITAYLNRLEEKARRLDAGQEEAMGAVPEPIVNLLRDLDVDYRIRRLRFVIRRLNGLYHRPEIRTFEKSSQRMDELKATLYEQIEHLALYWQPNHHDEDLRQIARDLCADDDNDDKQLKIFFGAFARTTALPTLDDLHDDIFSVVSFAFIAAPLRRRLSEAYIGFAFYDLVTFPVMHRREFTEVNEILVERISAADPGALNDEPGKLKGVALSLFGAFFNRAWREHDHLWGRLNAADRLFSTVLTAIGEHAPQGLQTEALRRNLFEAILEEEEANLTADPTLIAHIREHIAVMSEKNRTALPNYQEDRPAAGLHCSGS